ncbi:hypothetical protein B0H11DRAFT_2198750 [Mycena galericulata]|nr:hypothetical protein B0H11DRAFT_2198750 [Mycena galericulata]
MSAEKRHPAAHAALGLEIVAAVDAQLDASSWARHAVINQTTPTHPTRSTSCRSRLLVFVLILLVRLPCAHPIGASASHPLLRLVPSRRCTDASGVGAATASSPSRAHRARIATTDGTRLAAQATHKRTSSGAFAQNRVHGGSTPSESIACQGQGARPWLQPARYAVPADLRGIWRERLAMRHCDMDVVRTVHGPRPACSTDKRMRERDENLRCTPHFWPVSFYSPALAGEGSAQ